MRVRRHVLRVPGDPVRVASRMAVRLAHLRDIVEPLGETEFIWRPQPAEQYLFRCPGAVQVTVMTADEPGYSSVVFEWRKTPWPRGLRALPLGLAMMTAAALLLSPADWPLWRLALAGIPLLMIAATPNVMDSGWLSRLRACCRIGGTAPFDQVPAAERWLSLAEERREEVLGELRQASLVIQKAQMWQGADEVSVESRLGWPLRHKAWGMDPITGRQRVARGWVATGQIAQGQVAIGQAARGWVVLGQAAVGLVAFGQLAIGLITGLGQFALGSLLALGQLAAAVLAAGQLALGMISAGQETGGPLVWLAVGLGVAVLAAVETLRRGLMPRGRRRAIERQLAERRELLGTPDDASLSLAERLTEAEDPSRGLSQIEIGQ